MWIFIAATAFLALLLGLTLPGVFRKNRDAGVALSTYNAALAHLEKNPSDPSARKAVLDQGRNCFGKYSSLTPEAVELRIKSDIDARTGGKS